MKKYSIDITITNSTDPEIPEGVYIEAGSFSHSNHNATEHGTTIITWEQLTSFSLTVDNVHFKKKDISDALDGLDLNNGAGPGGIRPTGVAGGIVFESGRPVSFFGELFVPRASKSPYYNVSMGTSQAIKSTNINFGTNPVGKRGTIVASGSVNFNI